MKKIIVRVMIFLTSIFILLSILSYVFFYSMDTLPKGEFLFSSTSPHKKYTINIYIARGNATVAESIRGELVYNTQTKKHKNIYWQYRESEASVIWVDETHVTINKIQLDVEKDVYDYRRVH